MTKYWILFGLAAAVLVGILLISSSPWGIVWLVPALIAAGVAVFDALQTRHTLRRNYPLFARIRWGMEKLRPYVRSYVVEGDLDGRPFNHDERALIYARSKNQVSDHPMGTELDVYSDEYEWLGHSMAPNDKIPHEFRVTVGGPNCTKPYSVSMLNISAMSFGSLGANAIEALNLGARRGNFYHDTGEGSLSPYHEKHGGDVVWEIGSGYFGCRDDEGNFSEEQFTKVATRDQVKMIEIKLSQGAKPGHGGVLPKAKITEEIAKTRQIPMGQDCVSPAAHSAFSTPTELVLWADKLRTLSGGKPVGIKLCVGQPHEVFALVKAMLETGLVFDFIVVDGAEGGTGAAPVELSNRVGMPLREGLILVQNALVGSNLRDKIKVAAAGKVHSGAGLAMNAALGADWCNAARAFMFSIGCVQSMRCHTGTCPTGVATQVEWRQKGLNVEDKAERVTEFHKQTLAAMRDIVVAMGLESPWEIKPAELHERTNSARSDSMDRIYKFLKPGELLDHPEETHYARYWKVAQAESFRQKGRIEVATE